MIEPKRFDAGSAKSIAISREALEEAQRRSEELERDPSAAIEDAELWRWVDGDGPGHAK